MGEHQSERKVVRSALVGDLELDCDVFSVAGTDLRIVVYTAATGSDAAAKLDFLRVSAVAATGVSGVAATGMPATGVLPTSGSVGVAEGPAAAGTGTTHEGVPHDAHHP